MTRQFTKIRFSISSLMFVAGTVALVFAYYKENRKYAALKQHTNVVEADLGHIQVNDPTKVHLRYLRCDGGNTWQYRLFLPDDTDYVFEVCHNTGVSPAWPQQLLLVPTESGQSTITLAVTPILTGSPRTVGHTFMVKLRDHSQGVTFWESDLRFLANKIGAYENRAAKLDDFSKHNDRVDSYKVGTVIPVLHIFDSSDSPKLVDGRPAEIMIRLIPRKNLESDSE